MNEIEEKISEMSGDIKVIDQKLNTFLPYIHDQELRLRALEQHNCPFHQEVEKRMDKLSVDSAISSTKVAFILFIAMGILGLSLTVGKALLPIFIL